MKRLLFVLTVSVAYAACTGSPTASKENNTSTAASSGASSVSFPYTANFSSKFSIGKDSNSLLVLNLYKALEANDMNALANVLADSVSLNFADGFTFNGTRDSAVAMAKKFRDSLSSLKFEFDAWMPVHADDKNGDAVLTWYKQTDTYKNGKVDSIYYHDINGVKDGKIDFLESMSRKLKK